MTDEERRKLVRSLKHNRCYLCTEAANEIERLTKDCEEKTLLWRLAHEKLIQAERERDELKAKQIHWYETQLGMPST